MFTHTKLLQRILALILFTGGLFMTGKANACTAHFMWQANGWTVTFTDSGSSALSNSHTVSWSFGDGTSASTDDPHHTYSHNGTYHVCVAVYDNSTSCLDSFCDYVTVSNCALTSSFTYTVSGRAVSFTSTGSTSSTMKYIWNFGDTSIYDTTSGATASHTYGGTQNNYSVILTISDPATGCSAATYGYPQIALCKASSKFGSYAIGHEGHFTADSLNVSGLTYAWTSSDGASSTLHNFVHTFSAVGTYTVCLTATDPITSCSTNTCEAITISDPTYCIYGNVSAGNSLVSPCIVYLISFNPSDSSLAALDSFEIRDSSKFYEFCGLAPGTYYTKAALMYGSPAYSSYVPTYYSGATQWSSATPLVITSSTITTANITMQSGSNTGGPGFIGGQISAGANKTGDPEAHILVILYDANNKPIAYTYTDANGNYSFSNLPLGTYTIYVEIPGKHCTPEVITLTSDSKKVTAVNYSVNSKSITPSETSGIDPFTLSFEKVNVYPNPVTDKLIINTNLQSTQKVTIRVTDVAGKVISETVTTISNGPQALELDATTLNNGIYFVKMQFQNNKVLEARFVKGQ